MFPVHLLAHCHSLAGRQSTFSGSQVAARRSNARVARVARVPAVQAVASSKVKKVVLAYSGGLDTSVILKWLQDTYGCEVVTFTADLGQVSRSSESTTTAAAAAAVRANAAPASRHRCMHECRASRSMLAWHMLLQGMLPVGVGPQPAATGTKQLREVSLHIHVTHVAAAAGRGA
jgi:hypothetical protein